MSINQAKSTVLPDMVAAIGDQVLAPGILIAGEAMNWSAANRPEHFYNANFGGAGWASGAEIDAGVILFGLTNRRKILTRFRARAEYNTLRVGLVCHIGAASNTCVVTGLLDGGSSTAQSFTSAHNGTERYIDWSSVGGGTHNVELQFQWTVTSGTPLLEVREIRIRQLERSAPYPAPVDP